MKHLRSEKGFTLIELMIVVVIIGILAAIAIPNFLKVQRKAKEKACLGNRKIIFDGVNKYMIDVSAAPGDITSLMTDSATGWDGPYMKEMPDCPENGTYSITTDYTASAITVNCDVHGSSLKE